jgi:hypothetical protein
MFHCFETAFRSTVAVTLEDHYKIPRWWEPSKTQHRGGPAASKVGVVQDVSKPRLRSILLLVEALTEKAKLDVMAFQDGYELLENSTLGQIRRLLDAHWVLFKDRFIIKSPFAIHLDQLAPGFFRRTVRRGRLSSVTD